MMNSRPAVSSGSLLRVRDSLTRRFRCSLKTRALMSGISLNEFQDWVEELDFVTLIACGEGIAVTQNRIDSWDAERGDFLYWAFLKTRAVVSQELRKRNRRVKTVELREFDLSSGQDPAKKVVVREQLKEVLNGLNRKQGEALVLRYLMGFSVKDLERMTGRSGVSIYSLLQRAKGKARKVGAETG